jgi:hypothetical protein
MYMRRTLALSLLAMLGVSNADALPESERNMYSKRPICNTAQDVEMLTRLIVELGMLPSEAVAFFVEGPAMQTPTCQIPKVGPMTLPDADIMKTLSFRGVDYAYVRRSKILAVPVHVNMETEEADYMPVRGGDKFKYTVEPNLKLTPLQWKMLCVACQTET